MPQMESRSFEYDGKIYKLERKLDFFNYLEDIGTPLAMLDELEKNEGNEEAIKALKTIIGMVLAQANATVGENGISRIMTLIKNASKVTGDNIRKYKQSILNSKESKKGNQTKQTTVKQESS